MNAFFFIGSRRSGTTMLRAVLNAHPDIYCSYESGIMWILRYLHIGGTVPSVIGETRHWAHISHTFKYAGDVFEEYVCGPKDAQSTRRAFLRALNRCRLGRTRIDGPKNGPFEAIGEKDPWEYTIPEINDFILSVFPNVKFIHLVRHPVGFARGVNENPLRIWLRNETWAIHASQKAPTFTFRYEDLCRDPEVWVSSLYRFLVPGTTGPVISQGAALVGKCGNDKYGSLNIPRGIGNLREVASRYGYE